MPIVDGFKGVDDSRLHHSFVGPVLLWRVDVPEKLIFKGETRKKTGAAVFDQKVDKI
jgi:hypothetical protein